MIYSKEDVKRMLAKVRKLPRYDAIEGGCGDPRCCGTYVETVAGDNFVMASSLDELLSEIEESL